MASTNKKSNSQALVPATAEDLDRLLQHAGRGDADAVAALRAAFDAQPKYWNVVGDIAFQAEAALIEVIGGKNPIIAEAVGKKLETLRKDIAGEAPSRLEKLLSERVAACWLYLAHAEAAHANALKAGSMSFALSEYHQRRSERAQRRYLSAIKSLAQVRRLLIPVVQLNIAEKQVNVVSTNTEPNHQM